LEDVATPEAWARHPQVVLDFYNQRRRQLYQIEPNSGHGGIAELPSHFDVDGFSCIQKKVGMALPQLVKGTSENLPRRSESTALACHLREMKVFRSALKRLLL